MSRLQPVASLENLPDESWIERVGWRHTTNGYARPPWRIYRAFLSQMGTLGRTLEMGCGNGLLLRFLGDHSSDNRAFEPYGIDLNRDAIAEARSAIFPHRPHAFLHADLRDPLPFEPNFDLVLANPLNGDRGYYEQVDGKIARLYFDGGIEALIQRCWSAVTLGGRLFLWCYDGHVEEIAPQMDRLRGTLEKFNCGLVEKDIGPIRTWQSAPKN